MRFSNEGKYLCIRPLWFKKYALIIHSKHDGGYVYLAKQRYVSYLNQLSKNTKDFEKNYPGDASKGMHTGSYLRLASIFKIEKCFENFQVPKC